MYKAQKATSSYDMKMMQEVTSCIIFISWNNDNSLNFDFIKVKIQTIIIVSKVHKKNVSQISGMAWSAIRPNNCSNSHQ